MPRKKTRETPPEKKKLLPWQEALKQRIENSGYPQADFARAAGIRQETLNRILNRPKSNPTLSSVQGVLAALGLDIMSVFNHVGEDADAITRMVFDAIHGLDKEDKITLLRFITRLRNSPEKTSEILRHIMEQISK